MRWPRLQRRLLLASTVISIVACSNSTAPTAAFNPLDFNGAWQIDEKVTSCSGSRQCVFAVGATKQLSLRLLQSGTNVSGVIGLAPNAFNGQHIPVDGTIAADGTLRMTGVKSAASALDTEVRVTAFLLRRDAQQGLVGSIETSSRYPPGGEVSSGSERGDVIAGARRAADTSGFAMSLSGRWRGEFVIRRCVPTGEAFCLAERADNLYVFDLVLTQSGSTVNGSFFMNPGPGSPMTVIGSSSAGVLTLSGSASGIQSGVDPDLILLTGWSTIRDAVGQMHGTFTYRREAHWTDPRQQPPVWATDFDAELVGVTLEQ
jgi:hypothetical protein